MYRIKTLNKIASIGLNQLDRTRFSISDTIEHEDGILVRSASLHNYDFPSELRAIARAGAGTNNIPIERCTENGIVVFNAPGANANAVKELVICALLFSSRDIIGGADWVREQGDCENLSELVEANKNKFQGPELSQKTIGIIGLGAIGVKVANACHRLGMDVIGYDPFLSVSTAIELDRHIKVTENLDDLLKNADYISLHLPYNSHTANIIDDAAIRKMKGSVRILNFARGELVCESDIISALNQGRVGKYVTDFPTKDILTAKNVLALPHLGASTPESEENCAIMAARQLRDYLVSGTIINSINLPNVSMERSGISRLCLIHKNVPAMLSNIVNVLSDEQMNVENLVNKSKGDVAYTMVDVNTRVSEDTSKKLRDISGIIRLRVLHH